MKPLQGSTSIAGENDPLPEKVLPSIKTPRQDGDGWVGSVTHRSALIAVLSIEEKLEAAKFQDGLKNLTEERLIFQ